MRNLLIISVLFCDVSRFELPTYKPQFPEIKIIVHEDNRIGYKKSTGETLHFKIRDGKEKRLIHCYMNNYLKFESLAEYKQYIDFRYREGKYQDSTKYLNLFWTIDNYYLCIPSTNKIKVVDRYYDNVWEYYNF